MDFWIPGQPGLHGDFQDTYGYVEICLSQTESQTGKQIRSRSWERDVTLLEAKVTGVRLTLLGQFSLFPSNMLHSMYWNSLHSMASADCPVASRLSHLVLVGAPDRPAGQELCTILILGLRPEERLNIGWELIWWMTAFQKHVKLKLKVI